MISFSNITVEEFIRLNSSILPIEVLNYFSGFSEKISKLEKDVNLLERSDELAWEQVGFARDLIEQLDNFAANNLSKPKQKMYNQLRENTYFEV